MKTQIFKDYLEFLNREEKKLVSLSKFFDTNENALADMKRCAEEEAKLKTV